jgi:ribosomal protein L12E/L44/L45/RPP1/RPP2
VIGEAVANPQETIMANEYENNESVETTEANPVMDEPSNPISEGVTVDNDRNDDEVLDRIMGGLEEESPVVEAVQQETTPEAPVASEINQPEAETSGQPGEDYHRAMAALQRDGTPRSVLDDLYEKNPDEFVNWGLKREKVQKDGDRFSDEHAKLREQFEHVMNQNQPDQEGQQPEVPKLDQEKWNKAQPPTPQVLESYGREIADVFGDEAAESIMAPMRSMAVMLGQLLTSVAGQATYTEQQELAKTRTQLQERFPQLADDEGYGSVVERMKVLYRTGEYKNIRDLMTDAARISLADAPPPKDNNHAARSLGQPTARTSNSKPARSMKHEDREDAVLDALFDGGGLDGALKAYNS